MKTINLTDQELDHLREYYRIELSIAETDLESIKSVLAKLGKIKPVKSKVKKNGKPGRKPAIIVEEVLAKKKPGHKPKVKVDEVALVAPKSVKVKATNLVKPVNQIKRVAPVVVSKPAVESKPAVPQAPKKKVKKRKQPRRGFVTLAPLSKPLPQKQPITEPVVPVSGSTKE